MADINGYDFQLNGVGYFAAEDAEGNHYILNGEPLRPPNAMTIQGENQQKFQMRPDTLVWSLTDWSGGMGQEKFDFQQPNRWRELIGVRAFDSPGKLIPGYYAETTQDSTGSADFEVPGSLAVLGQSLVLIQYPSDDNGYVWDGSKWGAAIDLGLSGTTVDNLSIAGFGAGVVMAVQGSDDVYKWSGSGSASQIDQGGMGTGAKSICVLEPYAYVYEQAANKVWEVSLDGVTSEELILEVDTAPVPSGGTKMVAMNGRVYLVVDGYTGTSLWEITPSSAAGTGFGAPIGHLLGVRPLTIWTHMNLLFILGRMEEDTALFYFDPNGTYGTLGKLPDHIGHGTAASSSQNGSFLSHFFAMPSLTSTVKQPLFQVDAVSGGFAVLSYNEDGLSESTDMVTSVVVYKDDIFWSTPDEVLRGQPGKYVKSSWAISPWNDYGLADDKILTSLVLSCEALPANWTVYVDYAKDGSSSWTNAITYTTTSGTGTRAVVSTDSSAVLFRTLSIRIRMVYGGSGVPTTAPVVLGVDANATVAKQVPTWNLILDLSTRRGHPGDSGATKIANLKAAAALGKPVQFNDGYGSPEPGVFTAHDVIIDEMRMVLSQPGEGIASVVLREVV